MVWIFCLTTKMDAVSMINISLSLICLQSTLYTNNTIHPYEICLMHESTHQSRMNIHTHADVQEYIWSLRLGPSNSASRGTYDKNDRYTVPQYEVLKVLLINPALVKVRQLQSRRGLLLSSVNKYAATRYLHVLSRKFLSQYQSWDDCTNVNEATAIRRMTMQPFKCCGCRPVFSLQ